MKIWLIVFTSTGMETRSLLFNILLIYEIAQTGLLWLGETGENSNKWFTDCVELMKTNNIGWAWWPHKKIESISGPFSAYKLPGYQTLLNYWNGSAPRPSANFSYNALMAQANALLAENCDFKKMLLMR